jgi:hypothetical protein
MRTFYFVGGPINGQREAFLRRLSEIGGSPPGWRIYPHANRDGQALHMVETDSEASILAHIARFDPIYERGPIVEVSPGTGALFRPTLTDSDEEADDRGHRDVAGGEP